MANLFGTLNIPAANGPGAAFNLAGFAYEKTFVVQPGDANDRTTIEFSCNGTHWFGAAQGGLMSPTLGTPPSFFTFDPRRPDRRPQGFMSFGAAVQFCRVNRFSPLGGPAPSVGVAGDDAANNQFGALTVPAGNATGPTFNPGATFGSQWTFQLGGALTRGNVIVDGSIDGIVWVAIATFNTQQPLLQVVDGAFFALRVRKTQTLESETQVISFGNAGGDGGNCCTLNQTYLAGSSQADQTIPVSFADGGQVVFTGVDLGLYTDWQNPFVNAGVTTRRHYTMAANTAQPHFTDVWIEDIAAPKNRQTFQIGRNFSQNTYNTNNPNFYGAGVGANLHIESMLQPAFGADVPDWLWAIAENGDLSATAGRQRFFVEKRIAGTPNQAWGFGFGNTLVAANTMSLNVGGLYGTVFLIDAGVNIKHIRYDDIYRTTSFLGIALTAVVVKWIFTGNVTVEHNAAAPPAGTAPIFLAGSANLAAKLNDVLTLVLQPTVQSPKWHEDGRKIS